MLNSIALVVIVPSVISIYLGYRYNMLSRKAHKEFGSCLKLKQTIAISLIPLINIFFILTIIYSIVKLKVEINIKNKKGFSYTFLKLAKKYEGL